MSALQVGQAPQPLALMVPQVDGGVRTEPGEQSDAVPFASWLGEAVANVQAHEAAAVGAGEAFAAGRLDDIHGTMIALKEADIELRVLANVRNKMVDAFNELMRMSV